MEKLVAGIFLVLLVLGFAAAAVYEAGSVTIDDSASAPLAALGKSVIYYTKVLNSKLISAQDLAESMPSGEDIANEVKNSETKPVVKDAPKATLAGGGSVNWTNLLGTQESTIIFPAVEGKVLKLSFSKSSWNYIKYLKVYVNGSPVDCYYDVLGSVWNAFGGTNALVYGWGEKKEDCDYSVNSKYVLSTALSSNANYYSLQLTSPLIPSSCKGNTIQQNGQVVNATC